MRGRRYTVACLAATGVGPELIGEASRAVEAVSHMHGVTVDEVHVAVGADALTRTGQTVSEAARRACIGADAILAATREDPAREAIERELDVRATLTRVRFAPGGDLVVVHPRTPEDDAWTIRRAFELAARRRGRVTSVAGDLPWRRSVREAAAVTGVAVEELSPAAGLHSLTLDPYPFDVVVATTVYGEALASVAAGARGDRTVAIGHLAAQGPSLFAPVHGAAHAIAGQGVANPSSILLAAALMLGEGLGEHGAAATLVSAVTGAAGTGVRTADLPGSYLAATTREFTDVVLHLLPVRAANAEFAGGDWL